MLGWFSQRIFLGPAQRRLMEGGVAVYSYHRIAQPTPSTADPFLYVTPNGFSHQLAALRHAGFSSGSLNDLVMKAGEARGTSGAIKKIVITFDDGFRSVLENGLEVLAYHKFRSIQFLVAGFLGGKNEW